MITSQENIGRLWSIGVEVYVPLVGGWVATAKWQDNKFATPGAVEGEITTRYVMPTMREAIDTVVSLVERFNIAWNPSPANLYYRGDGEDPKFRPPRGWEAMLKEEAGRRGWQTYGE